MPIIPTGGWGAPKEGEVIPRSLKPTKHSVKEKSTSSFEKGFLGTLGVLVALWCVFFGSSFITGFINGCNTAMDTPPAKAPIIDVSAVGLNAAYEANEPAADEKYANKTLRVSGYVKSIDKDAWGKTYIVINDGGVFNSGTLLGVNATLNSDAATSSAALSVERGQHIVVMCDHVKRVIGSVMLTDCAFDDSTNEVPLSSVQTPGPGTPVQPTEPTVPTQSAAAPLLEAVNKPKPILFTSPQPPYVTHRVSPVYPPSALAAKISGIVTVSVLVDTAGVPTDAQIVKSVCPSLDLAALQAASQDRFAAAVDTDGTPIPMRMTIDMNFQTQ